MPPLILASTSVYRRELLQRLRLPFDTHNPSVREDPLPDELPPDRALRLALAKAQAVSALRPDAVVIGSDQVAALGSRVLDKPGDAARCREQLLALSGSTARFHTACAVISQSHREVHLDTTTVAVRNLSADEIDRYIRSEHPFDCAGGFKAEGLGICLFETIDSSDPTGLIGLPLIWLAGALRTCGYELP